MAESVYRIGVISDTHGLLRQEVKEILGTCQVILHGGDVHREAVLDELRKLGAIYVVRGNNDGEWAKYLKEELKFELFGIRILMIHNKRRITTSTKDRDLVIYGHSHKYEEIKEQETLWLNPGSCGIRRFGLPLTMAVVTVQEGKGILAVEKIEIEI